MRWLAAALLLLVLAGCGFQLRRELALPAGLEIVRVETPDAYGPLQRGLEQALQRAGARPGGADQGAVLRVVSASLQQLPLSVGATGRVQEFMLDYRSEIELIDAAGVVVLPRQPVQLQREYSFDTAQAIGSPAEEELIREEMERAMVEAIVRRLDSVLRSP